MAMAQTFCNEFFTKTAVLLSNSCLIETLVETQSKNRCSYFGEKTLSAARVMALCVLSLMMS